MARPLYDRTTAKPLRLDAPRPLRSVRISARHRHRLGFVAAALCVAGAVALAVKPETAVGPQPASLHPVSRGADATRKVQVAKPPAEIAAQRRPDPPPPSVPATVEPTVALPVPARAEDPRSAAAKPPTPASDGPAVVASLQAPSVQPRSPEPSVPPEAAPKSTVVTTAAAPLDCVAAELRTVLADVAARFGPVTVVSTHRLNSDNHSPGTIRHRLHAACKAVDFKTAGKLNEVLAFLRSRPEVSGINSYRGGLIHIDLNENVRASGLRARPKPTVD
jgi:hypothetical protein